MILVDGTSVTAESFGLGLNKSIGQVWMIFFNVILQVVPGVEPDSPIPMEVRMHALKGVGGTS